jgi:hypothetical protein
MNAEMQIVESVRGKAVWGSRIRAAAALTGVLVASLPLSSCSEAIRTGQSPSYLIITSLQAAPGGTTSFGPTLQSDVLTDTGGIFADQGQVILEVAQKDPLGPAATPVNSITITQYHVDFIRSDGRNTQGVDVPFAFDGAVTATVPALSQVGFTIVRIQAKEEAPLKALARAGGANAISAVARVTFYGHDQNGREVSVTGNISITFSDWAG